MSYQCAGVHGVAGFEARGKDACLRGWHHVRLQHGDDLAVAGIVLEADQGEGGVALDHGIWILQHRQQSLMEFRRGIVLAHNPNIGDTDFVDGILRERDDLRIPLADGGVAAFDAAFKLREDVLDFAGVGAVDQGFCDLRVGDGAAEPGGVPEQERHDYETEREDYDAQRPASAEGFFWLGGSCRLSGTGS